MVTPETVRAVARLARLELTAAEADEMAAQLSRILDHMEALAAADSAASGPADGVPEGEGGAPLRADEPGADPMAAGPEGLAPAWADGFFTVPRLESHG